MPSLDRTGPEGQGSMTGRKMGKCASKNAQDSNVEINNDQGLGMGRRGGQGLGRGLGRGLGNGLGRRSRNK